MYYCPLKDAKGRDLEISKIQYKHLSQIQDIDEGYKVEYKSEWNSNFKEKHLAKVITSFANTEGGWLFVGVKDDCSISEVNKERTDFGQQIGEIIRSKVSPYPRFETKFVTNPINKKRGVLIVYIHEGFDAPYICQGTVHVRNGSSKVPVNASDRIEIDHLIAKHNKYQEKIEKFCVNEIFPKDYVYPYCAIYIYNKSSKLPTVMDMWLSKDKANNFAKEHNFQTWMITTDSILFYNSKNISVNSVTTVLELFIDGNIKIYVPLPTLHKEVNESICMSINSRRNDIDLHSFTGIDGFLSHMFAYDILKVAFLFLLREKVNMEDYLLRIELQNIKKCYLFFKTGDRKWIDSMCGENFCYSNKIHALSADYSLGELNLKKLELLVEYFLANGIFSAFGMMYRDYIEFDNSVRVMVRKHIGEAETISTEEYYQKLFGI